MTFTVADLKYIEPDVLKEWILRKEEGSKLSIIDVRDSDYIGGHIKGSKNIPSTQIQQELPKIYRDLKVEKNKNIIFHCTMSQQRGPSNAMKFLRYLNQIIESPESPTNESNFAKSINVYVLRGGFAKWQELYGDNKQLTEDYDTELWANSF